MDEVQTPRPQDMLLEEGGGVGVVGDGGGVVPQCQPHGEDAPMQKAVV